MRTRLSGLALLFVLLAPATAGAQWAELDVPARPSDDSALVDAGREIYMTHCWTCHGEEGDGAGPVAEYLWPRPRDFRIASFKFRTTPSGELPTDEDLFRTITLGAPGTAMPAWGDVLSEAERWQVIAYVKSFGEGIFEDEAFDPYAVVVDVPSPPDGSPAELAEAGREVFQRSDCWECHGQLGRGDGPKADRLTDDWNLPIRATDLEMAWKFRGGGNPRDAYLRLTTGLDGTPMPSYAQTLSDEERWQVAYYVASLATPVRADGAGPVVIRARPADGPLPEGPDDTTWARVPTVWIPLTGQGTFPPRWQIPSITDLAVQAMYDDEALVLRLRWDDQFADSIPGDPARAKIEGWSADDTWPVLLPGGERRRGTYRDALELLFPASHDGPVLPHFVYGDARHPVDLWRWTGEGEVAELRAVGVERLPEALPAEHQRVSSRAAWVDGRWTVILRRPLAADAPFQPGALVPVAFHVRDGSHGETGLRMAVSSWYFLQLREPTRLPQVAWVLLIVLGTAAIELVAVHVVRDRARRGALRVYGINP
jgi:mono/diheme cytochrome c family protein